MMGLKQKHVCVVSGSTFAELATQLTSCLSQEQITVVIETKQSTEYFAIKTAVVCFL